MSNTKKLIFALIIVLIAVGVHCYLAVHYYNLNFGFSAGESVCNVNSKFNCDTVTASPYSAIGGIPVALFGAAANAILSLFLVMWILGLSSNTGRVSRYTLLLSGVIAVTSIVMGSISTFFVGAFCPFCMSEYAMSFVIFGLIYSAREREQKSMLESLGELAGPARSYLIFFAAIPVIAFLFHQAILDHFDAKELPSLVRATVADWQSAPELPLTDAPAFIEGNPNAKMVIAEFADFRCPHCRHASAPIKAYVSSHSDVQLRYYTFPLDGVCNDMIPGGDGVSCLLAKAVVCSQKLAQKGAELHDQIYNNQEEFQANPSVAYIKEHLTPFVKTMGIKAEDMWACVDGPDAENDVRREAKAGAGLGVKATPTFFVNGRQLSRGQLIPVLDAVHAVIVK